MDPNRETPAGAADERARDAGRPGAPGPAMPAPDLPTSTRRAEEEEAGAGGLLGGPGAADAGSRGA